MSEKLKKYNFLQQLEQGYIRIPRIQRGYAQGRLTKKVDGIRRTFLHTLFQVIKGNRKSTELDFVYGSMKDGAFEPLDGQQRLTTLFLIHWMLGTDLRRKEHDKKSVFTYASCPTSEDFSNELVSHNAAAIIKESIERDASPSELIMKRDWFHWKWKFDPSISSMLVMIDSIREELISDNPDWENNMETYRHNLNNITFNGLNLGDFGLSNELFIKMNARGKQLSDFDKMKSTLEEEIQIQESEHDEKDETMTSEEVEASWRTLMDGKWSDYFWHTYARNSISQSRNLPKEERKQISLAAAKNCELQFKKLILRLIQLQLHAKMPASELLREACYKMNAGDIDDILVAYGDSLMAFRSKEGRKVSPSETLIDFEALIRTVNSLLTEDEDGTIRDVYASLDFDTHFNREDTDLMQSFLSDTLPNDVALTFHASLKFLEEYPASDDDEWKKNLSRWIKSFRNMLANYNNTQRIDKRWRYEKALDAIKDIADDLRKFGEENHLGASDKNFVCQFFNSIKDKTYIGIDNQALKEESEKAALVLRDPQWEKLIAEAEKDAYLWGQIRALLQWAGGDMTTFESYYKKLADLLGFINEDCNSFYIASLIIDPGHWLQSNRMYQLNFDRDNSFKRYLRDFDKDQSTNAPHIRNLIDLWISTANDLSAEEFIRSVISGRGDETPAWIECMIDEPSILDYCNNKRLFNDRGHVILAQYKTTDSHCIDPVLKYLHTLAVKSASADKVASAPKFADKPASQEPVAPELQDADKPALRPQITFYDSKGDSPHSISFVTEDASHHLKWSNLKGMYELIRNDGEPQICNAKEAIERFIAVL